MSKELTREQKLYLLNLFDSLIENDDLDVIGIMEFISDLIDDKDEWLLWYKMNKEYIKDGRGLGYTTYCDKEGEVTKIEDILDVLGCVRL